MTDTTLQLTPSQTVAPIGLDTIRTRTRGATGAGGAGTSLVEDIWAGDRGSSPGSFASASATLFFVAGDGIHGRELWGAPL